MAKYVCIIRDNTGTAHYTKGSSSPITTMHQADRLVAKLITAGLLSVAKAAVISEQYRDICNTVEYHRIQAKRKS